MKLRLPLLRATIQAIAALPAAALPATAAEEWPLTLSARSTWAENLSRTSDPATARDAAWHEFAASTDLHRQLTADWQFTAEGSAAWETVPRYDALEAWRFGAHGVLRRKFGLGPLAPALEVHAAAVHSRVDEDGRSGTELAGGLRLAKRLNFGWRAAAGVEWSRYYARHAPFDVRQSRAFLEATWDVTDRWQLTAGAARIDGQITANASGSAYAAALAGAAGPAIQSYYRSIPWHVTHTYGPGWVAYRVDARADEWWAGLAVALGENTSLPLRYEHVEVTNRVGVRYVSEFWSLGLVHRL